MATFALSGRSDKFLSLIPRSIDACSKAGFRIITGVKFKLGMCAGEGTEHLSHCCCWGHSEREPGLAGSELPCLARSRQSFVCNKPWSALWALHLSGYQGQAGQWEVALSTAAALTHSNISTAHRGAGAAFVFDVLELQTSSPTFHKTYTDASISSEVTWHRTSLHKGVRSRQPVFRTGRQEWAVQGLCLWDQLLLLCCLPVHPLSALQQTQLSHCCSSGTGHFWPGFTGATTLVPAACPAPWEWVRLCSDKGRREFCSFSRNTLPTRREKFKKLTDLPC